MEQAQTPVRRVALVSGGAGGIGAAVCAALAAQGRAVAIADLDGERAESVAARLRAEGGEAIGLTLDVTDPASVSAAVARAREALGQVGVLVNNAGWDELRPFVATDEGFWQRVIDVNFTGALRLTHAALPAMVDAGWGRVLCVSSDAARVGSSLESVYAGAKGALISFAKSLARETARKGVTVNAICPGPTDTPLLSGIVESAPDAAKAIGAMTRAVPMKRLGQPADVAAAVAFLTSEQAGYVTGQTLSVSGGLTMA
ncbi:MAG TPA: SDR family NAD(P)-dependent oxidoreductase [Solirubrobacteraceae bacterium]|nr:SDR family NAD(P)-dependent oxidoreductase [Solirubrobacteraceae bacterium]